MVSEQTETPTPAATRVNSQKLQQLSELVDLQTKKLTALIDKTEALLDQQATKLAELSSAQEVFENSIGANESMVERVNLAVEALIRIHNDFGQWIEEVKARQS